MGQTEFLKKAKAKAKAKEAKAKAKAAQAVKATKENR